MPTQATANAMFGRFHDYLQRRYPQQALNFHLLHGQAPLSAEYQQLRKIAQVYGHDRTPGDPGHVMAQEWFTYRKRGLLALFAVGTIDQALMAALPVRHGFVRMFGLAYKTIILDEVHAYDTYTSNLLDQLLQWLSALGCSVVLLSATLPTKRRHELIEAYTGRPVNDCEAPYPRITVARGDRQESVAFTARAESRKTVQVEWASRDFETLAVRLEKELADGGCVACVCNTVHRAQKLYEVLTKVLRDTDIEVDLFHARFPFDERDWREKRTQRRFGKDGSQRPVAAVLVATQVIEQSLDIDFDLMVSDLAPVDLLLQRAGRLHRHQRDPRPSPLQDAARLQIIKPLVDSDGLPEFDRAQCYIYPQYLLLATWWKLQRRDIIRVPEDVEELIERVYAQRQHLPNYSERFSSRISSAWDELQKRQEELQGQAQIKLIRAPEALEYLGDMIQTHEPLQEDRPEIHPALHALTRWSDAPSVTVVCLYGSPEQCFFDQQQTEKVDLHEAPDDGMVKKLLGRSLSLSGHTVYEYFIDAERPPTWRRNTLLRNLYPAFFDQDGKLYADNFELSLDPELGLVVNDDK